MADCPSGRYASEIVTAGGLTLAHPTEDNSGITGGLLDWSGSEAKFADWNALALTLIGRLERAWSLLKAWPATASMPIAKYRPLEESINDIRARYAAVRKPWTSDASAHGSAGWSWGITTPDFAFDATEDIGKLTGIIVDAQCLRQKIDDTLAATGGTPDHPGDTGHKPSSGLGILGTAALVLGSAATVGVILYTAKKVMA